MDKKCLHRFSGKQNILSVWPESNVTYILQHEQQVVVCCQTDSDYGPSEMTQKLPL